MTLITFLRGSLIRRLREPPAAEAAASRTDGPDFICIGAPKTGTAWLFDQLNHHPDFWMPPVKELHGLDFRAPTHQTMSMFDALREDTRRLNRIRHRTEYLRALDSHDLEFLETYVKLRRGTHLSSYAKLFSWKKELKSGDITPAYSALRKSVIAKVARRFPHTKIVFQARDPIDRFWSQYCMYRVKEGTEFVHDIELIQALLKKRSMIGRSFPTDAVARWSASFSPERFKVFFFDDLRTNPEKMRRDVLSFIGGNPDVPSGSLPAGFNRKVRAKRIEMPPRTRDYLTAHFREELLACADILGGPAKAWPAKHGV